MNQKVGDRPLDDAGRAVVAGKAGNLAHHVHKDVLHLAPRAHRHLAQTLAGQAQALGLGAVSYTHLTPKHQYSGMLSLITFANLSAAELFSALPPGI